MAALPQIVDADGKLQLKYGISYDSDSDGKAAASLSLLLEVDKAESIKEIIEKLGPKLPDWAKAILGIK
jgi:hypothetical protein